MRIINCNCGGRAEGLRPGVYESLIGNEMRLRWGLLTPVDVGNRKIDKRFYYSQFRSTIENIDMSKICLVLKISKNIKYIN